MFLHNGKSLHRHSLGWRAVLTDSVQNSAGKASMQNTAKLYFLIEPNRGEMFVYGQGVGIWDAGQVGQRVCMRAVIRMEGNLWVKGCCQM